MELLKFNKVCEHTKVPFDVDFAYCPDCGELIENQWFLVRCNCCGVKLKGFVKNGKILPERNFCHNCGGKEFFVERINKINFIDISYAVLVKSVVRHDFTSYTQSWVDTDFRKNNYKQQLLQQFL